MRPTLAVLALTPLLAIAAPAVPARAQAPAPAAPAAPDTFNLRTAGELARICAREAGAAGGALDLGFCYGYTQGAVDYHRAITPANANPLWCAPTPPPSFDTLRGRYVAWVNENPANASMRALDSVFMFLRTSFPCPTPPAAPARRR
jgi:hypothetical protein